MSEVPGTPWYLHLHLPPVHFSLQLSHHLALQSWQHLTETQTQPRGCQTGGTGAAAPLGQLTQPSLADRNAALLIFLHRKVLAFC